MKFLKSFFTNILLALLVGLAASSVAAVSPVSVGAAVFSTSFTAQSLHYWLADVTKQSASKGLTLMAVQVEFWQDRIEENLFKYGNEFLNYSVDASKYVIGGTVVHIPQAGSAPTVTKNATTYPLTVATRADTDVTYPLDTYRTSGVHIPHAEKLENSVDKASSVLNDENGTMTDRPADEILYKWSTSSSSNILRTTGSLSGDSLAPSATGTRKQLTRGDLTKLRNKLKKSKVKGQMVGVVPTDMYGELLADDEFMKSSNVHVERNVDLGKGEIRMWQGILLIERIDTTIYDNTPAPKLVGATAASTDNQAVIAWIDQAVERSVGSIKFFENTEDAIYQGDVYSAFVKAGGRQRRSGGEGVAAIVQTA